MSGAIARTIVWNAPTTSRASTSAGTSSSTAATVSVSALVKRSRPVVSHRARVSCRWYTLQPFDLGLLRPPTSRRPFPDHGAAIPGSPVLSPCAKARSRCGCQHPTGIEPGQIGVERALSDPEDVGTLAAQNRTHHLTAVAQALADPADWNACLGERADGRIRLLPPQVSLVLDALSCSEQRRINRGCADDLANLSHRPAHGIEEASAGILHEVPTVGDLDGLRQSTGDGLAISTPRSRATIRIAPFIFSQVCAVGLLAVGQERYDAAAFEIADEGTVAVVAPPGEVVDADDVEQIGVCRRRRRITRRSVSRLTAASGAERGLHRADHRVRARDDGRSAPAAKCVVRR